MIHFAKTQLTRHLLNAPLIVVEMSIVVGTFRLWNNLSRRQLERVGQQFFDSRMRPVHAPQ
jgi:hypothetical protein